MTSAEREGFSRAWTGGAVAAIAVITFLHYATHGGIGALETHTLFRRLYYLPIAVLAVVHGVRGGALAGGAAAGLYAPHAFMSQPLHVLGIHLHADPSPAVEKVSEIVLFVALGSLVGFAVDRARHARRELGRTRVELERASRLSALGQLVAGIAHEVKNPLASLHATAEMFLDDYPEGHERRRMAVLNFEEVKRLERVVGRFLAFARPGKPAHEPVAVRELLEKTEALAGSTARQRSVELVVTAPDPDTRVTADADQLVQVLLNLVLNAVEVSPEGGRVTLDARTDHDTCVVTVDDEGPGVPEDLRERVFDPFFTTRADGTGLGLSIASQIVLAHGGALACQAADGGGGRFVVRLPLEESE